MTKKTPKVGDKVVVASKGAVKKAPPDPMEFVSAEIDDHRNNKVLRLKRRNGVLNCIPLNNVKEVAFLPNGSVSFNGADPIKAKVIAPVLDELKMYF